MMLTLSSVTKNKNVINVLENDTTGVRTRGKSHITPMQWTKIPVLVKIFKLIIYELGNYLEASSTEGIQVIIYFVDILINVLVIHHSITVRTLSFLNLPEKRGGLQIQI